MLRRDYNKLKRGELLRALEQRDREIEKLRTRSLEDYIRRMIRDETDQEKERATKHLD